MRKIIAAVIGISSIMFSIWFGVWFMLVGGIVCLVEAVKANPVDSFEVAYGVCRIIFAGFAGVIGVAGCLIAGKIAD